MKPTYLNIRRFTREKLKEGWTRQQIFDHLMESAGSGARNDYARVMRIATLVARFPVQALNWKIRWVRALMIFGMLAAIVLSWSEQLPLARMFGLLELPWYIIGLWIVSANFFNLLSILLLGPALRMNRKAYLWIMILNIFSIDPLDLVMGLGSNSLPAGLASHGYHACNYCGFCGFHLFQIEYQVRDPKEGSKSLSCGIQNLKTS